MNEHYLVTVDRRHLRIYTETRASNLFRSRLEMVESIDFSNGGARLDDGDRPLRESPGDGARRSSARRPAPQPGAKREPRRRAAIARQVNAFLRQRPSASWDLAASPSLYRGIVEELSADARRRLKRVLSNHLAQHAVEDIRSHFAVTV